MSNMQEARDNMIVYEGRLHIHKESGVITFLDADRNHDRILRVTHLSLQDIKLGDSIDICAINQLTSYTKKEQ